MQVTDFHFLLVWLSTYLYFLIWFIKIVCCHRIIPVRSTENNWVLTPRLAISQLHTVFDCGTDEKYNSVCYIVVNENHSILIVIYIATTFFYNLVHYKFNSIHWCSHWHKIMNFPIWTLFCTSLCNWLFIVYPEYLIIMLWFYICIEHAQNTTYFIMCHLWLNWLVYC